MPMLVNNTTFPNLLDLLAPHSCRGCGRIGYVLCDCCKKNIINDYKGLCPLCKTTLEKCTCKKYQHQPLVQAIAWRHSLLGVLIQDLKYHSTRSIATPLAEILNQTLHISASRLIVVPLPTITKHIRRRGLDHTLLIAHQFAKLRPDTEVSRLILRTNSTTQVGSSRAKRLKQASNAYEINSKIAIRENTTYLLLDDVWTTGASMTAAIELLQNNGINNILGVVLTLSS